MNSEFELIDLFNQIGSKYYKKNGVIIPPGDDCAVFESKKSIVTSVDASIEGIHFLKKTKPQDIAYRSIAIDLYAISWGFVFFKKCMPSIEASTDVTILFLDSKTAQSSPGGIITPFFL